MENNTIFQVKKNSVKNNVRKISETYVYNGLIDYYTIYKIKKFLKEICVFFSERIAKVLFDAIDINFNVKLKKFELVQSSNYKDIFLNSRFINSFHITSSLETGIINFSENIILSIIDILFGGINLHYLSENNFRKLTISEMNIMKKILNIIQEIYSFSWKQKFNIDIEMSCFKLINESDVIKIFSKNPIFLSTIFQIKFGNVSGLLNIGLPLIFIKSLKNTLMNQNINNNCNNKTGLEIITLPMLYDVKINLNVKLVDFSLLLSRILKLKIGDIIPIRTPEDDIIAYTNNIPVLVGKYKTYRKKHAFLLKSFFNL
ncbi:MAG: FliM/FliN family flagellar motor switch protein [Buchnera aphidicola (Schlechtendalia peitan)]